MGGKLEVDAPAESKRKKPRTDDTVEPVFFHSMPVAFYHEILEALNIIGVIDLCPGEGTCAIACIKKTLPYVGVAFNEQHSARLMAHLEKTVLNCMVTQGDPLYDVKFADAVRSELPVPPQPLALRPTTPAKPKRPTPVASPTATPAAKRPKLKPEPDDDDPLGSEAGMSGDDKE